MLKVHRRIADFNTKKDRVKKKNFNKKQTSGISVVILGDVDEENPQRTVKVIVISQRMDAVPGGL